MIGGGDVNARWVGGDSLPILFENIRVGERRVLVEFGNDDIVSIEIIRIYEKTKNLDMSDGTKERLRSFFKDK